MNCAVGPLVPEHPIRRAVDQACAVLPRHIDAFGGGQLKLVRQPASIVLQLAAAAEAQGLRKLVGLTWQFGGVGADFVQSEAALLGALHQPRQFAQRQPVEDQHRLGAVRFGPPAREAS
jgi:hypothetical protein